MKKIIDIFKTILTLSIISLIVYAWARYTILKEKTPVEIVNEMYQSYQVTWYQSRWQYTQDLEKLQEFKQLALDELSYVDTVKITKWEVVADERLNLINKTIELNTIGMKAVTRPEYLNVDTVQKSTAKNLDFQKLLK